MTHPRQEASTASAAAFSPRLYVLFDTHLCALPQKSLDGRAAAHYIRYRAFKLEGRRAPPFLRSQTLTTTCDPAMAELLKVALLCCLIVGFAALSALAAVALPL